MGIDDAPGLLVLVVIIPLTVAYGLFIKIRSGSEARVRNVSPEVVEPAERREALYFCATSSTRLGRSGANASWLPT